MAPVSRTPPTLLLPLAVTGAMLLAGCTVPGGPDAVGREPGGDGAPRTLDYHTVEGCDAEGSEARYTLLRDRAAWRSFWQDHCDGGGSGEATAAPEVDFATRTVVAVFWGPQKSGGHSVAVAGIVQRSDGADVEVVRTAPGEGCGAASVITYPHHLVSAERIEGEADFRFTDRDVPC